jgi:xanthine dehydrogenase YagS FAD-binding subunit
MMPAFEYAAPKTRDEAIQLLAGAEAMPLAGGTDLLSLMKDHLVAPKRLVSLKGIAELRGVAYDEKTGLRIGAMTTLAELDEHLSPLAAYPALCHAMAGIHSPQIQNMGTVGGELLQRPRCWYYRTGFGLLAQVEGKSLVPEGDNRYHAILGNAGPAYYVHASSLAPALIALGAKLKLLGPKGEREVALEGFFKTPQNEGDSLWDLAAGEIVTDILVPAASGQPNATYEVRQHEALDWPLAAAAVALKADAQSRITEARIVLGHVAPVPWPVPEAAKALLGGPINEETAGKAGEIAVKGAGTLSKNGYKVRLARVAVKRALLRAMGTEV